MQDWKSYLQPAATLLVALSLGAIAIDNNRASSVRFKCAQIYAGQVENNAAYLGLKVKKVNANDWRAESRAVNGYCDAFLPPRNLNVDIRDKY